MRTIPAVDAAFTDGGYTGEMENVVELQSDVDIYGGFAGTESVRDAHDWTAYVTTIDGEDSRRCVLGANSATLDGFTLKNGKTDVGAGVVDTVIVVVPVGGTKQGTNSGLLQDCEEYAGHPRRPNDVV